MELKEQKQIIYSIADDSVGHANNRKFYELNGDIVNPGHYYNPIFSFIMKFGLCLTSSYILDRYSPMIPSIRKSIPNRNKIKVIRVVKPGTCLPKIRNKDTYTIIAAKEPIERNMPSKVTILSGK